MISNICLLDEKKIISGTKMEKKKNNFVIYIKGCKIIKT